MTEKIVAAIGVAHLVADMRLNAVKWRSRRDFEHSQVVVVAVVARPIAWFVEAIASRGKSSQSGLVDRRCNKFGLYG
jgi:hypothetical protein